jgi:hypothetical protein
MKSLRQDERSSSLEPVDARATREFGRCERFGAIDKVQRDLHDGTHE